MSRIVLLVLLVAVLLTAGVVLAEEKWKPGPPTFTDGRLNQFDPAAPVAIYYKYEKVTSVPTKPWMETKHEEQVLRGIELLSTDPNSRGNVLLFASIADIQKMIKKGKGVDCCIAEGNGVSLHWSTDGWFWVEAVQRDGKIYSFQWQNLTIPVVP